MRVNYILFLLFIVSFISISSANDLNIENQAGLAPAVESFQKGDVSYAIKACSEIIVSGKDAETVSKAYIMLSIGYILQDTPDTKDKCATLTEFLSDSESPNKEAIAILKYLSDELSESELLSSIESSEKDWKAAAAVCRYLKNLKNSAGLPILYSILKEYMEFSAGLSMTHWSSAWYVRIKKWHQWIQSGNGQKDTFEKLVAENGFNERTQKSYSGLEEQYSAISQVIELYLANRTSDAGKECKNKIAYFSNKNDEKYRPTIKILEYLSGKPSSLTEMFEITKTDPSLWTLASISMFVGDLAFDKKLNHDTLLQYLSNYNKNVSSAHQSKEIIKWKARTEIWEKWCKSEFSPVGGLEPLPAGLSKKTETQKQIIPLNDITEISLEDFTASREPFTGRPRPSSLDFDERQIGEYIQSLPPELRQGETNRLDNVKKVKPYLVKIMERNIYDSRQGIKLRRQTVKGTIALVNDNLLIVKSGKKKSQKYKWSDLAFEQYENFFIYYAQQRLTRDAGGIPPAERKEHAANDYLLLALLCDWYGHYENTLKYVRKAVEISPEIKPSASRILLK